MLFIEQLCLMKKYLAISVCPLSLVLMGLGTYRYIQKISSFFYIDKFKLILRIPIGRVQQQKHTNF